jgi:hypothetical protein
MAALSGSEAKAPGFAGGWLLNNTSFLKKAMATQSPFLTPVRQTNVAALLKRK